MREAKGAGRIHKQKMATTFHTAIFAREGTLGLTIAECESSVGQSPPFLQHEACRGELHYDATSDLACSKCGRLARDGAKLYVRGDFAICRSCALRGAGVLVDPGAKRIWFSRMIQFVGSRAVPLPASQPILAQLLRTLKSHPGVVVRFEGHVNSTCDLDCRGATGKPCKAARKVGSDMCARCPGGAYGLSKARAEAIKSFVAKCGVDVDRVYAVGFAGTRRLSDDITEEKGAVNRRVEVHMMPYAPPGRL